MYIGYTEEQEALRAELRAYYAKLLTPEVQEELSHSGGVGAAPRRVWKHPACHTTPLEQDSCQPIYRPNHRHAVVESLQDSQKKTIPLSV